MATAGEQVRELSTEILSKDFETLHREWLEKRKEQGYTSESLALLESLKTVHEYWFTKGQQRGGAEVALVAQRLFG